MSGEAILTSCRLCKSSVMNELWELEPSPYGDLFCKNKNDAKSLSKRPLTLQMCESCRFIQLGQEVDVDEIYKNYLYNSSNTYNLPNFYKRVSDFLINLLKLKISDLIVDVGSNDGSGLLPYLEKGFKVLGIEPSKLPTEKALSFGIATINSYLDKQSAIECISKYGQAKLVMANYVAANVPDPVNFFSHLKTLISPDGAISIITGYYPDQFSINMFEYINHDHLSYFSVQSAIQIADLVGLKLISAERIEHKGGSIHLIFRHEKSNSVITDSVSQLLQRESWMQIDDPGFYDSFKSRIHKLIDRTQTDLPPSGLVGIGASISTTHLLHQFQIGERFDVLLDDDTNKIGKYSPGYAIPVKSLSNIHDNLREIGVLLAWQHSSILTKKILQSNVVRKIYMPLPNSGYFEKVNQ